MESKSIGNPELYCPFCKDPLEYRINSRFWCQHCHRLWWITMLEQFVGTVEKDEQWKNEVEFNDEESSLGT